MKEGIASNPVGPGAVNNQGRTQREHGSHVDGHYLRGLIQERTRESTTMAQNCRATGQKGLKPPTMADQQRNPDNKGLKTKGEAELKPPRRYGETESRPRRRKVGPDVQRQVWVNRNKEMLTRNCESVEAGVIIARLGWLKAMLINEDAKRFGDDNVEGFWILLRCGSAEIPIIIMPF